MLPPPKAARIVELPVPSRGEVAGRVATGLRAAVRHLVAARRCGKLDPQAVAGVVRGTFDDLGGTFTKFGQLIASAPSLFGEDVAAEFRGCLDAGPAVPFGEVRAAVQAELVTPFDQAFAAFDAVPVAAASLAVVHRAVLADLDRSYGPGLREMLGTDDDDAAVAMVRSQIEPMFTTPFGQVDLRTMLIGDGTVDGKRAGSRTRIEVVRNWWEERRRQRAIMASDGYGGDFDRAQFLLAKQLVYFERYGKRYLPDVPLLDDPAAFRALLSKTVSP